MAHQRRLDLARLDPEPAQLHLRVRPPEKLQNPVATPARQVPGPVHPAPASPEWVRNEPLGGQPGTPEIAARKPRPRNVKLARNPGRHRHQAAVQNINPRVRYRSADGNGILEIVRGSRVKTGAERRAFGRAIAVDQLPATHFDDLLHVSGRKNVAARQ